MIEWVLKLPFRRRGSLSFDIQEKFPLWLLQAVPSSYQFAVRVQKSSEQLTLFKERSPNAEQITQNFFEIVRASSDENLEELEHIVPDDEYRDSFLKLTRNLAPSGKSFDKLEIRSATEARTPILLVPESRKQVNQNLKALRKLKEKPGLKTEQIEGVLRGLQLDKDWLEITVPGQPPETIRIHQTGDMIDDVVGPMVNHKVVVEVLVQADGKCVFRDIQPFE